MNGDRADPVLILARAAGFGWPTVRAVLNARPGPKPSPQSLDVARENFERLTTRRHSVSSGFGRCVKAPGNSHLR